MLVTIDFDERTPRYAWSIEITISKPREPLLKNASEKIR